MAYSRDDIDRVRERSDLLEMASEVTKIKRSGRSAMAVCPFHQEKTPSLSIDPERGLYHCFGCGKSGDVFRWVQETEGLDFVGALEMLARRAGVTLTEDPGAARRRDRREELLRVTEMAVVYYHDQLRSGEEAGEARSYLRGRGYESTEVDRFKLGYSPAEWDRLVRHLQRADVSGNVMIAAGLALRSRQGRLIDRFRGRVMFPIYDVRGDAVGFGARLLSGDGPKYLNSPESPIYHKSRLLYGLNWAKGEIVRTGEAVVVEGYTDVIAFHRSGFPVAVATCGTALGEDHLDLLRRFTDRVVLAFDADEAGAGAALRGFEKAVPGDLDLRVAMLPPGQDPADLVDAGDMDGLKQAVAGSIPLLQFRIERELAGFDLAEAEARGRAVNAAAPLIGAHPDDVVRHEYAVMISRRTGVDLAVVRRAVERHRSSRQPTPVISSTDETLSGSDKAERELLRLVMMNHAGLRELDIEPGLFDREVHRDAWELIAESISALPPGVLPDLGALIGGDDSAASALLRRLALEDRPLPEPNEVVKRLKVAQVERRIEGLRAQLERGGPAGEDEGHSSLLEELIALERQRREMRSQA